MYIEWVQQNLVQVSASPPTGVGQYTHKAGAHPPLM
jgi:hypothetical protein